MEKSFLLFVCLAVNIIPEVTGSHCGAKKQDLRHARIPDYNSLLSMAEFESFIVDKRMGEMYFALERPPAFVPYVNYKSTITRVPGSSKYMQLSIGETVGANSQCERGNVTFTPMFGLDKTLFFYGAGTTVTNAMWSSCPTKYIWSMRCLNYVFGKRKCPLSDTHLGIMSMHLFKEGLVFTYMATCMMHQLMTLYRTFAGLLESDLAWKISNGSLGSGKTLSADTCWNGQLQQQPTETVYIEMKQKSTQVCRK